MSFYLLLLFTDLSDRGATRVTLSYPRLLKCYVDPPPPDNSCEGCLTMSVSLLCWQVYVFECQQSNNTVQCSPCPRQVLPFAVVCYRKLSPSEAAPLPNQPQQGHSHPAMATTISSASNPSQPSRLLASQTQQPYLPGNMTGPSTGVSNSVGGANFSLAGIPSNAAPVNPILVEPLPVSAAAVGNLPQNPFLTMSSANQSGLGSGGPQTSCTVTSARVGNASHITTNWSQVQNNTSTTLSHASPNRSLVDVVPGVDPSPRLVTSPPSNLGMRLPIVIAPEEPAPTRDHLESSYLSGSGSIQNPVPGQACTTVSDAGDSARPLSNDHIHPSMLHSTLISYLQSDGIDEASTSTQESSPLQKDTIAHVPPRIVKLSPPQRVLPKPRGAARRKQKISEVIIIDDDCGAEDSEGLDSTDPTPAVAAR